LLNGKNTEKTLDMFLTEKGLPKVNNDLEIEVKGRDEIVIDTRVKTMSKDVRAYVLDEFKDILFPKHKNKYELAHDNAMARRVQEEE